MTLNALGLEQSANVIQWVSALFRTGFHMVGIVVLFTVAVIPLLKLLLLFYVSMAIRFKADWHNLGSFFRFYQRMDEWGMLEICMLGILVSIIKLKDLAPDLLRDRAVLFCLAPDNHTSCICYLGRT